MECLHPFNTCKDTKISVFIPFLEDIFLLFYFFTTLFEIRNNLLYIFITLIH